MKKIVLFNGNMELGGITEVIFNLALLLKEKNIDYTVFCLKIDEISLEKFKLHNLKINIIETNYGYYNPLNLIKIYQVISKYDCIHVNDFPSQLWTGLLSLFFSKKRLVLTEHSTKNNRRKYKIFKYVDKLIHSRFDIIVSITKEVQDELKKWYGDLKNKKYVIINNGVNLEKFSGKTNYIRTDFEMKENDIILVMVSRIDFDTKDYLTLLKAMKKLKDDKIKLLIIGDGKDLQKLQNLVDKMSLKNKIKLLGKRSDVHKILPICDIGILSSHFEGFGIAALEMMASELPVVVTEVDGLKQIVEKYGLTYRLGDDKDLVQKIIFLLEDKKNYLKVKRKCTFRSKDFSFKKCFAEYLKVYNL